MDVSMQNRTNPFKTAVSVIRPAAMAAAAMLSAAAWAQEPLPLSAQQSLSPAELKIWNDPAFQKQFAESYIAETDIEPRVTSNERDRMLKVMGLISSDKMSEAAAMLEKQRGPAASAVFDFTLANIFFQQEKLEEAAAAYTVAVEKYPKFRRAIASSLSGFPPAPRF